MLHAGWDNIPSGPPASAVLVVRADPAIPQAAGAIGTILGGFEPGLKEFPNPNPKTQAKKPKHPL